MGNKVIDGTVEWIKDDQTGDVVGYKRRDGTERGIASVETNPVTGRIELVGPEGAIPLGASIAIPVSEYGLFPANDSTTDQTLDISSVLASATSEGVGLFFPPGRYNYNGLIDNIGCSVYGVYGQTFIHSISADGKNSRWNFPNSEDVTVYGITFVVDNTPVSPTNNGTEPDGILRFQVGKNITVEKCDFFNPYGTPVLFRSVVGGEITRCRSIGAWKDSFHITGLSRFIKRTLCEVINGGDDAFPVVGYRSTGTVGQPTDIIDAFCVVRGVKSARGFAYVGSKRVRNYGCQVEGNIPAEFSPSVSEYTLAGLYISSELNFDSYHNEDIVVDGMSITNCGGPSWGAVHIVNRSGVDVAKNIVVKNTTIIGSAKQALYIDGVSAGTLREVTVDCIIEDNTDPNGRIAAAGAGSSPAIEVKFAGNVDIRAVVKDSGGEAANIATNIEETLRLNLKTYGINKSGLAGKDIIYVGPNTVAKEIFIDLQVVDQTQINSAGTPYFLDRIVEIGTGNFSRIKRLNVSSLTNLNKGIVMGTAAQAVTVTASPMTWQNTLSYPVLFRIVGGSGLTVQKAVVEGIASPTYGTPNGSKNSGYYMVNPGEAIKLTYSGAPTQVEYLPSFE